MVASREGAEEGYLGALVVYLDITGSGVWAKPS